MRLIDADDLLAKVQENAPGFMDSGSTITKAFIMAMINTKSVAPTIDAVPVVRCRDCKHRPKEPDWKTYESGFDLEFPEGSKCPCRCCGDEWYSWYPEDDWYCADGERIIDDA